MKIMGIIEAGKLTKELAEYECLKCGAGVMLEFSADMTPKTKEFFLNLGHACLCQNCYCDSKVPEIVECLFH